MKKTLIIFAVLLTFIADTLAFGHETPSFDFHKLNYFIVGDPGKREAQAKFQFSIKKEVFKEDFHKYVPLFAAYTQKSFWDIGKESAPFSESNYNPEVFLDYPIDAGIIINSFRIKSIAVSPYEHESNGMAGLDSRSWNRYYAAFMFELKPKDELAAMSGLMDKIMIYTKLWGVYEYSDQKNYLNFIGKGNESFLDYVGRGEVSVNLRDFLFEGNQIDFKTRIFRDSSKNSYEAGLHIRFPSTNFFVYAQYWYGYGESLLRFDKAEDKVRVGVSFPY